jgi:hypothetical protein
MLSQALTYFLGSALIVRSQPPATSFPIRPLFVFLYNTRYIIASLLIVIVLFFCYAVFFGRPKSIMVFTSEVILRWSFIPLIFFIVNFLNNVVLLLQENSLEWFIIGFYLIGLIILIIVFLRLLFKAVSLK